ncbi:hypothetical protein bcgnr5378_08000 [Bacillus cereus]
MQAKEVFLIFVDNLQLNDYKLNTLLKKANHIERLGRKATGLRIGIQSFCSRLAGLPKDFF